MSSRMVIAVPKSEGFNSSKSFCKADMYSILTDGRGLRGLTAQKNTTKVVRIFGAFTGDVELGSLSRGSITKQPAMFGRKEPRDTYEMMGVVNHVHRGMFCVHYVHTICVLSMLIFRK